MASPLLGKKLGKVMTYVLWFFAFYITWKLVPAGYGKWMDPTTSLGFFESMGYGAAIFWAVTIIELVVPFGLFFHKISFYAASSITVVMAFASFHSGWDFNPLSLTVLALIIAIMTRPQFLRKTAKITKITI